MKHCLSILLPLLFASFSFAQTVRSLDDLTMSEIDNVIQNEISQSGLPGVSVGIVYNGRVAFTKAYGLASPGNNATVSTKYPIASVSKTITGILAMKMIENGDIALNDPISNYVGGYNGTDITIRHLLSHQSGIGHYNDCGSGYSGPFNATTSQLTVLGCSRCMSPPGSGTIYTTFGSTLLGCIIDVRGQQVYNKSYIQLYNDWIKNPAGLTNLTPEYNNLISGIATGYNDNNVPVTGYWDDIGWRLPAGGFVATAHDLADYGAGVMNYSFITQATSTIMWTQQTTSGTPTNNCNDNLSSEYALAFRRGGTATNREIFHNGLNNHGYSSLLYLFPDRKSGFALLTNRDSKTGALSNIQQALENTILCPANRQFTSNISWGGNWIYEAGKIEASNTFSATVGEIVFDGANEVVLKPGFHAQAGISFRAIIDGCSGIINPY